MMECFPSHRSTGSILEGPQSRGADSAPASRVDRTRNSPRLEKCAIDVRDATLVARRGSMHSLPETDGE